MDCLTVHHDGNKVNFPSDPSQFSAVHDAEGRSHQGRRRGTKTSQGRGWTVDSIPTPFIILYCCPARDLHKILLSANGTALKCSIGEKCNNKNRHALLARLLRPWLMAVVVLLVAYPQHASLQLRHPHYDVLINSQPVTVFRHSIPC